MECKQPSIILKRQIIIAVICTQCAVVKMKSKTNSVLCNTNAVLYQLSYQANWEPVTLRVCNLPVDCEEFVQVYFTTPLLSYVHNCDDHSCLYIIPQNSKLRSFITIFTCHLYLSVADLGEGPRGPAPPSPLCWVKKEEITEGRKASRASKPKDPPPTQGLDLSFYFLIKSTFYSWTGPRIAMLV